MDNNNYGTPFDDVFRTLLLKCSKLIIPDKSTALYQIPVIKVQQYTKEEIFDKKLLFFITYYILKFEKEIPIINSEQQQLTQLTADYEDIYTRLCQLEENKFINSQYLHDLIGLTSRLIDVVAHNATNIRKEVSIVGGKVLELESERILKRGLEQGREEGLFENIQNTIKILRDLDTSEEIIKEKIQETFNLTEAEVLSFMTK